MHITTNGYKAFGTEFLFDDDERLVGKIRENSIRNDFMIANPEKTAAPFAQKFSYTIQLQKSESKQKVIKNDPFGFDNGC